MRTQFLQDILPWADVNNPKFQFGKPLDFWQENAQLLSSQDQEKRHIWYVK